MPRTATPRRASLLAACLLAGFVKGQDLGRIGQKDPFSVTGGLNAFGAAYTTDLGDPRMAPFTWGISGRMSLNIYDLQIPFSFVFSEKEREFRQPFNQYGLSPRYKWITAHIGHRTMQFSELTMSSQRFFGGGLELNPGKFRFAAMYGQLRREVFADTTVEAVVEPAFERRGMGVKLGVGSKASHFDLVVFSARDLYDSLELREGRYGTSQPEENVVVGLGGALQVAKNLQWQLDAAGSLHNVGLIPAERTGGLGDLANNYDTPLFNIDPRSRRGTAIRTGLCFNVKSATISVNYERIDPLFTTLGNYFFLKDVENFRGTFATGLFKQKLRISLSAGLQTNDLARALATRTRRTIGSATLSYNSGKVLTTSLSWSNFEANVRAAYEAAGSDTLTLRQVSDNITFSNSLRLRDAAGGRTQNMDVMLGYQTFVNDGYPSQEQVVTSTMNGSIGYRSSAKQRAFSWGARITMSLFESAGLGRTRYGASLNARKGFDENKLGISGRAAFYLNRGESYGGSTSLVANLGIDRKVARMHSFGLAMSYNGRSTNERFENSQYQLRVQATYSAEFRKRERKPSKP